MRRFVIVGLAALATMLVAGCGDDDDNDSSADSGSAGELFVLNGDTGRLTKLEGEHNYELVLDTPAQSVATFLDRPERKAGTEDLNTFVEKWSQRGFDTNPPNAALVIPNGNQDADGKVFELSKPVYAADEDGLTFLAHDLGDTSSTALASFSGLADADLPPKFDRPSLFVDDAGTDTSTLEFDVGLKGSATGTATVKFDSQTIKTITTQDIFGQASIGENDDGDGFDAVCRLDPRLKTCVVRVELTLTPAANPVTGTTQADKGMSIRAGCGVSPTDLPLGKFSVKPCP